MKEKGKREDIISATPFDKFIDFSIHSLQDVHPGNLELWPKINQFKCEEIFCFFPLTLITAQPDQFQIKAYPDIAEASKIMPMYYWCMALYFPELQSYMLQSQNYVINNNKVTEGNIVTMWYTDRKILMEELMTFFDYYSEHDRMPVSPFKMLDTNELLSVAPAKVVEGKQVKLGQPDVKKGDEGRILGVWYYFFLMVLKDMQELYIKQYVANGWAQKQAIKFTNKGVANKAN